MIVMTSLPPHAVPGIQRVARELGVDHAPAMMGWDFRSGHCRPVSVDCPYLVSKWMAALFGRVL